MDWRDFDTAVRAYKREVNTTLAELQKLRVEAEGYSKQLDQNEEVYERIEAYERRIGYLRGKRTELYEDHAKSLFESDHMKLQKIEGERDSIDTEIGELEQSIAEARRNLVEVDGVAIAKMISKLSDLNAPTLINVSSLNYIKPIPGHHAVPAFLDKLVSQHKLVTEEISKAKSNISDMERWSDYYDTETYRQLTKPYALR